MYPRYNIKTVEKTEKSNQQTPKVTYTMKQKTKYKLIEQAGFSVWEEDGKPVALDWSNSDYDKEVLKLIDLVESRTWRKAATLTEAAEPILAALFEDYADELL